MSKEAKPAKRPKPGASRQLTPRARDLPALDVADIPVFDRQAQRVGWIAERIASGQWRTEDIKPIAQAWEKHDVTVRDYATKAAMVVELHTDDIAKIRLAAVVRLHSIGEDYGEATPDRLRATELMLKVTGALRGGSDEHTPSAAEVNAAIFESVRNPNDEMLVILRRAFSDPSDTLRGLLAEFAVVNAKGEER